VGLFLFPPASRHLVKVAWSMYLPATPTAFPARSRVRPVSKGGKIATHAPGWFPLRPLCLSFALIMARWDAESWRRLAGRQTVGYGFRCFSISRSPISSMMKMKTPIPAALLARPKVKRIRVPRSIAVGLSPLPSLVEIEKMVFKAAGVKWPPRRKAGR
jgi:hypothetical protein